MVNELTEIRNRSQISYGLYSGCVNKSEIATAAVNDVHLLLEFLERLANSSKQQRGLSCGDCGKHGVCVKLNGHECCGFCEEHDECIICGELTCKNTDTEPMCAKCQNQHNVWIKR
jgi:hypothetical protein